MLNKPSNQLATDITKFPEQCYKPNNAVTTPNNAITTTVTA